jgi:predicted DNA-binding transcriptional regulator YafY
MGSKNIYERFVWFDNKVKSGKYPNATSLSSQFEISVKTSQRDIEFMRDRLNCPLLYEKSQKGYFYEDDTFSLPMVYLSSEELSSLLIARKFLKDISGGYVGKEISSIIEKITTILKKHVAEESLIDNALSFQLIEYSPAPEEVFKAVLEGCLKKRSLSFTYRSLTKDDKTTRTVDPYHLLNYMGTWHLIAYCHLRQGLRNFVFGRISDLKILENTFTISKGFNIHEHLQSAFGIYKGIPTKEVCLRFSPEKARWIIGQVWHKDQKTKVLKDGSLELSFPVASFAEIMMEILKHGSGVEVIRPKALRELVEEEAREILKIYNREE